MIRSMIACNISMDVMGIREEELIDGLEFASMATSEADEWKKFKLFLIRLQDKLYDVANYILCKHLNCFMTNSLN